MNEELQPYAVFIYILVAVSFIITPWAAWRFWQWRKLVASRVKKTIFTVVPIVMITTFTIRILVLFKFFESVNIEIFGRLVFHLTKTELGIVLSYISTLNGILIIVLLDLATRVVRKEVKRLGELELEEELARRAEAEREQVEGSTTSEILAAALKRGREMNSVLGALSKDFLHTSKPPKQDERSHGLR